MTRPVRKAIAAPIMLLAALSLGCVVQGGGVSATAAYGVGYFGPPVGFSYGVWGPRYWVAPYRPPVRGRVVVPRRRVPPTFHPAPIGRVPPSIPLASRPVGRGRR